jgi:hypothetical protein
MGEGNEAQLANLMMLVKSILYACKHVAEGIYEHRRETKSKDVAREGWSVLPVVIGDSRDVDSSSLGESAFFLSERGILLLKEVANQGIVSGPVQRPMSEILPPVKWQLRRPHHSYS